MKSFVKRYFDTPKVPVSFYLNENTIPIIVVYLLLVILSNGGINFAIILAMAYLALIIYTFSWLSDYKLYMTETGRVSGVGKFWTTLIYQRNVFFKKSTFVFAAADALVNPDVTYATNGDGIYHRDVDRVSPFMSNLKHLFLFRFIVNLTVTVLIMSLSPFMHLNTMKKYRALVQEDELNSNTVA